MRLCVGGEEDGGMEGVVLLVIVGGDIFHLWIDEGLHPSVSLQNAS